MKSVMWLAGVMVLATSLSCTGSDSPNSFSPSLDRISNFKTGRITVFVYWDEQGIAGKRVDVLELDRTKFTREDGTTTFRVPVGTFTVRVYEINRGGPAWPWVDTKVTVTAGEDTRVTVVDCLPCV